jgi:hypothetical protein
MGGGAGGWEAGGWKGEKGVGGWVGGWMCGSRAAPVMQLLIGQLPRTYGARIIEGRGVMPLYSLGGCVAVARVFCFGDSGRVGCNASRVAPQRRPAAWKGGWELRGRGRMGAASLHRRATVASLEVERTVSYCRYVVCAGRCGVALGSGGAQRA